VQLALALILLLFDRHTEDIRSTLQESDVMLAELSFRSAVDFEHSKWQTVALQNDIHGTADSVFDKQFRSSKSFLIFEMIGNHGLAGVEGVASRRIQIGSDGRAANHAFAPTDARANKQTLVYRNVLQDFAIFGIQAFSRHPRGVTEQVDEARALQGQDPEFGEQLLLPNT
jgi:hypothetical protein